jgi:hypothetical protein
MVESFAGRSLAWTLDTPSSSLVVSAKTESSNPVLIDKNHTQMRVKLFFID